MMTDEQTNVLYYADTLPKKHREFYTAFDQAIADLGIIPKEIPGTRDVWAKDYMPVQINESSFVLFRYQPDYLVSTAKWRKTISDTERICQDMGINCKTSDIVLDGGNISRGYGMAILCDKVFKENQNISEKSLVRQLETVLEVEKIIFIPTHPFDITGHSDGILRWYGKDTVLINDYRDDPTGYGLHLRMALHNAGLDYIEIPYYPYENVTDDDATGEYINFLWMQQGIVVPLFGMKEDNKAMRVMEQLFPWKTISTVKASGLSIHGGVLNCISWNIYQNMQHE